MTATLHIQSETEERDFACGSLVTIGRGQTNDVVLLDPKVSRSHAILRCLGDGRYYLMDTGSSNGVIVNGKRVVVPCALADSDQIKLGDHILVFHEEHESSETAGNKHITQAPSTVVTIGSVIHTITILLMDIRDFSLMSEKMSVDLLAILLARWFHAANEIIEKNGGVVDKFIGDAVMARWLTDEREADDSVTAAMKTAYEMNLASQTVSKEFSDLPFPLTMGVGINTGQAVLGDVGTGSRHDYTALGDAVNLAFRFESISKALNTDVVLGPDSYQHFPKAVWENHLQSVNVKWKTKPVPVCVLSFNEVAGIISFSDLQKYD